MKTNVPMQVMAQQSAELRQQVNSQPFKPAVVVGKVELKPRVEVKMPPKLGRQKPQPPKPVAGANVKERKLRRAESAPQTNGQMMAELQFVKKQLREAKERGDKLATDLTFLRQDVKDLLAIIPAGGFETLAGQEPFKRLQAQFEAAPGAGFKIEVVQTDLGPPKPMVPVLMPLETVKKLAASDDLVKAIVESKGIKL